MPGTGTGLRSTVAAHNRRFAHNTPLDPQERTLQRIVFALDELGEQVTPDLVRVLGLFVRLWPSTEPRRRAARVHRQLVAPRTINGDASVRRTPVRPTNHHHRSTDMPATTAPTEAAPVTRQPKDPEATALATAAQDLARSHGLKSKYTSGEARGVIDAFTVTRARGTLTITRADEQHRVKAAALKALLAGERRDEDDVRAAAALMRDLSRGLPGTMYGRKTAAFLLALAA